MLLRLNRNLFILSDLLLIGYQYLVNYKSGMNLNYSWNLGFVAGLLLAFQILSGFFLTLFYVPNIEEAFLSVQSIMRDVKYGWLIRYIHLNTASFFFAAVYLHILKGLYYSSYKNSRIIVWYIGVVIYILMMATAFFGYVLPWGQMSYWAATVITSLFSVVVLVGKPFVYWLWGGFSVDAPTLTRLFSLHYILPFVILFLVCAHIYFLHVSGSSHTFASLTEKENKISFFPFYIVKDLFGLILVLMILLLFICFNPEELNHVDNYIQANPLVTPPHILPEWYFLPYYGMLKVVFNKTYGVLVMFASMIIFFLLPMLDSSRISSNQFSYTRGVDFYAFILNFISLGIIGKELAVFPFVELGTFLYHMHFGAILLIILVSSHQEELSYN